MKIALPIVTISLACICFTTLPAQQLFPDETTSYQWHYVTWQFWGGSCSERTVVTGNRVELCRQEYIEVLDCDEFGINCNLIGFYRVQGDSVMIRTLEKYYDGQKVHDTVYCSKPEGLMFDFGIEQDTVVCQLNNTLPPTKSNFWKIDEQLIEYQGERRKTRTMIYQPHSNFPSYTKQMKWIDGIGSDVYPLYTFTCIGDHCEIEQQLTKVYKNDTLIYLDTTLRFPFPCSGWTTQTTDTNSDFISLSPNPSDDWFHLKSAHSSNPVLHLSIFSLDGQRILQRSDIGTDTRIEVDQLPSGVYIVEMQTSKGNIRKRLVLR